MRHPHALCDGEVTLTVSQYVESKVKLDGEKKNQIPFTAKIPTKIRKKFLICLVMVDNQDNKSSSGLILFQARKTC